MFQIGEAMRQDPGFLKLRKIRAAQKIAKTVSEAANNRVSIFSTSVCSAKSYCLTNFGDCVDLF